MDMLVNGMLVLEVKIEAIAPVHKAQLLSYLKLINFNVAHLRDGIVRQVNGL